MSYLDGGDFYMKKITILIPAYNESEVIHQLFERVTEVMETSPHYQYELLFVNDGSTDDTMDKIKKLQLMDTRVSYVDLSRNYGKEIAMAAGFDYAKGDAVIIMDADLQHPPELIPKMIFYWEEGYMDVYAKRVKRKGESWFKRYTSKKYYEVLQRTTRIPILADVGDFRLLDRECIEALKLFRESQRNTKGMYSWIGFKKKEITYEAEARAAGKTKWGLFSLIDLAIEGITSFTTFPLRLSTILGFSISLLAFIYLIYIVIKTLLFGSDVSGYPSIMVVILFLGGIQLITIGIIGEYLGRIFNETKNRPLYFVSEYNSKEVQKVAYEKVVI